VKTKAKSCLVQTYIALYATLANDELWCSSFAGAKGYDLKPLLSQTVNVGWLPFVGWAFAVVSTLWAIIAFLLTIFVRRHCDYESINY